MNMPRITIFYSLILIALGLFAYFVWADQSSRTALIPAYAGGIFLLGGLLSTQEKIRKHMMHVLVFLALGLLFATARSFTQIPALLAGEEVLRPLAVKVQFATAVVTIGFLALAIRSFILARRL